MIRHKYKYISPIDACDFNFSSTCRFNVNISFLDRERSDHGLNSMFAAGQRRVNTPKIKQLVEEKCG